MQLLAHEALHIYLDSQVGALQYQMNANSGNFGVGRSTNP
jgi:hypothetical protein